MKKKLSMLSLLGAVAVLIVGAIALSSCEGPAGPMGPQGPAGEDGTDGIDGVDGTDGTDGVAGNAVCLECHTQDVKDAVTALWAASLHGTSQTFYPGSPTTVAYAGGRVDCAKCHSAEGFIETVWTGQDTTATTIPLPTGIRCKACHDFHSSLDFENEPNSAIRTTDAVTLLTGDGPVEFSNAESNLCMNCHQSRTNPSDDTDGTVMVKVEEHYGPHHGPQANLLNGLGGYEFRGEVTGGSAGVGPHDCLSCHMGEVVGDTIGGHTWAASIEGCSECHGTVIEDGKAQVETLLAQLEDALFTAGMVDADGHAIESDDEALPPVLVEYQADSVGALWNYIYIEEEASHGVHNLGYTIDLLTESIAFITGAK